MARHPIPDLLPGTLDLLILGSLPADSLHGWAISERPADYCRLTPSGRRQLAVEADEWERMVAAVGRMMKLA